MSPSADYHLGPTSTVTANARGSPGRRTFYLDLADARVQVRVWLEKREFQALGLALEQLAVEQAQAPAATAAELAAAAQELPTPPTIEFNVEKIAVGYDRVKKLIVLVLEGQKEDRDVPKVTYSGQPSRVRALGERIASVCAAGRPACPLCYGPMDPEGHVCPKANGHHDPRQL